MTWEQRMSERAKERHAEAHAMLTKAAAREWDQHWADLERMAMEQRAKMTLGEALDLLNTPPWACACIGPPLCCRYSFIQAQALQRAAHIVVKLISEVK